MNLSLRPTGNTRRPLGQRVPISGCRRSGKVLAVSSVKILISCSDYYAHQRSCRYSGYFYLPVAGQRQTLTIG